METNNDEQSQVNKQVKRTYKYDNEQERHEASKVAKRKWYYRNKEQQKRQAYLCGMLVA